MFTSEQSKSTSRLTQFQKFKDYKKLWIIKVLLWQV
nr:MAG TPA: hypothetical protein [Caudoviricetes sp.]DAY34087.1 MAG TPA: hypothetical protein [Caudoviricetes sp.]